MLVRNLAERSIWSYEGIITRSEIEEILRMAEGIKGCSVTHVNSTRFGGGVAEILHSMVPLMRSVGINAEWEVMKASQKFFQVTKKLHNALQGGEEELSKEEIEEYLRVNGENAENELHLSSKLIVVHDPQPLPIRMYVGNGRRWVWRCHIDLSTPNINALKMISGMLKDYDASIFHLKEFIHPLIPTPRIYVMPPSIDPLSDKNKDISEHLVAKTLNRFDVDPERPMILQVGRFDPWKNPFGAVDAYRLVKKSVPEVQLVMAGVLAHDDPEGFEYLGKLQKYVKGDRDVHVLSNLDGVGALEINAFQRAATIVLQLSLREGFGLAVTEALWKKRAVIATPRGGLKLQIIDGVTGYIARNPGEAAEKAVYLIKHPEAREKLGANGKKHVLENFIIPRHLTSYLRILREHCEPG